MKKIIMLTAELFFIPVYAHAFNGICPDRGVINAKIGCSYVEPCYTIDGKKYCNADGGAYFYDHNTNEFYMALTSLGIGPNSKLKYIGLGRYVIYNPQTKEIKEPNLKSPDRANLQTQHALMIQRMRSGDKSRSKNDFYSLINVNTVKTLEQAKAEYLQKRKKEQEQIQQELKRQRELYY